MDGADPASGARKARSACALLWQRAASLRGRGSGLAQACRARGSGLACPCSSERLRAELHGPGCKAHRAEGKRRVTIKKQEGAATERKPKNTGCRRNGTTRLGALRLLPGLHPTSPLPVSRRSPSRVSVWSLLGPGQKNEGPKPGHDGTKSST